MPRKRRDVPPEGFRCGVCGGYGHNARTCKKSPGPKPIAMPEPIRPPRVAIAVTDVPTLKTAVVTVVEALEPVASEHRERVIESAMLILGGRKAG